MLRILWAHFRSLRLFFNKSLVSSVSFRKHHCAKDQRGTGIFRTPWTVMQATQSVGLTLLFWLGGAMTVIAGTVLYIEFGLTLPRHIIDGAKSPVVRNGGDLNYVMLLFVALERIQLTRTGELFDQAAEISSLVSVCAQLHPIGFFSAECAVLWRRRYRQSRHQSLGFAGRCCTRHIHLSRHSHLLGPCLHSTWRDHTQQRIRCGEDCNSVSLPHHGGLCRSRCGQFELRYIEHESFKVFRTPALRC
jgi:hypothetical protein